MPPARHHELAIAGLLAGVPLAASAHGPKPAAQAILFDEDDPPFVYVATTVFGHFVSHDGGESFGWICSDVFADGTIESFPIDAAALAGSSERVLLIAGTAGLSRSTDDGCSWSLVDQFDGRRTSSVVVDPSAPDHVLVTTDQGATPVHNALFESNDAGATFVPTSLSGAHFFRSPRFGPDGSIWVASLQTEEQVSYLHRSSDGGMSFAGTALPDLGTRSYRIAGFPGGPDAVLLRAGTTTDDVLVLVRGDEATVVLEPGERLHELRTTSEGHIEIGDGDGKTWRSIDDGETWQSAADGPSQLCYAQRGGSLYACGRQLEDRVAISVSPDDGATWSTFFAYEQMTGVLECLAPEPTQTCTVGDRLLAQCFELDEWGVDVAQIEGCPPLPVFGDSTGGDDSGGTDDGAGVTDSSGGCGCRTGSDRPALALLLVVLGRRRRYKETDA